MDRQEYDIVYSGALVAGRDPAQVKSDLAKLFKTDTVGIERLFCSHAVIIKKGIDQQTALKYQSVLEKVGAVCEIRIRAPADATGAVPSSVSAVSPAADNLGHATIAPVGSMLTAPKEVKVPVFDLSAISIAELGADILEGFDAVIAPPLFDLSELSLAPTGIELIETKQVEQASFPDFAGLSIADRGVDIEDTVPVVAALPDVSGISIAPVGAEIIRPEEMKPRPLPPDITKFNLSLETTHDSGR